MTGLITLRGTSQIYKGVSLQGHRAARRRRAPTNSLVCAAARVRGERGRTSVQFIASRAELRRGVARSALVTRRQALTRYVWGWIVIPCCCCRRVGPPAGGRW